MATSPATNARIVELLEQIQAQLAETRKQQDRLARDVGRLLAAGPKR